jgi:hypothetical protein
MPSATTAESSDSIAASSAKAIASGSTACAFCSENAGNAGDDSSRGMPPKRLPIVSTGNDSAQVSIAASTTAIRMPGQDGRKRRSAAMTTMLTTATAMAAGLAVRSPPASAMSLGTNSPGSFADSVIPPRSLSWLAKMIMAMPAVKPTVTG